MRVYRQIATTTTTMDESDKKSAGHPTNSSRDSSAEHGNVAGSIRVTFEGVGRADPSSTYVRGANRMSTIRKPIEDGLGSDDLGDEVDRTLVSNNIDADDVARTPVSSNIDADNESAGYEMRPDTNRETRVKSLSTETLEHSTPKLSLGSKTPGDGESVRPPVDDSTVLEGKTSGNQGVQVSGDGWESVQDVLSSLHQMVNKLTTPVRPIGYGDQGLQETGGQVLDLRTYESEVAVDAPPPQETVGEAEPIGPVRSGLQETGGQIFDNQIYESEMVGPSASQGTAGSEALLGNPSGRTPPASRGQPARQEGTLKRESLHERSWGWIHPMDLDDLIRMSERTSEREPDDTVSGIAVRGDQSERETDAPDAVLVEQGDGGSEIGSKEGERDSVESGENPESSAATTPWGECQECGADGEFGWQYDERENEWFCASCNAAPLPRQELQRRLDELRSSGETGGGSNEMLPSGETEEEAGSSEQSESDEDHTLAVNDPYIIGIAEIREARDPHKCTFPWVRKKSKRADWGPDDYPTKSWKGEQFRFCNAIRAKIPGTGVVGKFCQMHRGCNFWAPVEVVELMNRQGRPRDMMMMSLGDEGDPDDDEIARASDYGEVPVFRAREHETVMRTPGETEGVRETERYAMTGGNEREYDDDGEMVIRYGEKGELPDQRSPEDRTPPSEELETGPVALMMEGSQKGEKREPRSSNPDRSPSWIQDFMMMQQESQRQMIETMVRGQENVAEIMKGQGGAGKTDASSGSSKIPKAFLGNQPVVLSKVGMPKNRELISRLYELIEVQKVLRAYFECVLPDFTEGTDEQLEASWNLLRKQEEEEDDEWAESPAYTRNRTDGWIIFEGLQEKANTMYDKWLKTPAKDRMELEENFNTTCPPEMAVFLSALQRIKGYNQVNFPAHWVKTASDEQEKTKDAWSYWLYIFLQLRQSYDLTSYEDVEAVRTEVERSAFVMSQEAMSKWWEMVERLNRIHNVSFTAVGKGLARAAEKLAEGQVKGVLQMHAFNFKMWFATQSYDDFEVSKERVDELRRKVMAILPRHSEEKQTQPPAVKRDGAGNGGSGNAFNGSGNGFKLNEKQCRYGPNCIANRTGKCNKEIHSKKDFSRTLCRLIAEGKPCAGGSTGACPFGHSKGNFTNNGKDANGVDKWTYKPASSNSNQPSTRQAEVVAPETPETKEAGSVMIAEGKGGPKGGKGKGKDKVPQFADCRNYTVKGKCDYGDSCQFQHDDEKRKRHAEARSQDKLPICMDLKTKGHCTYGDACRFKHA